MAKLSVPQSPFAIKHTAIALTSKHVPAFVSTQVPAFVSTRIPVRKTRPTPVRAPNPSANTTTKSAIPKLKPVKITSTTETANDRKTARDTRRRPWAEPRLTGPVKTSPVTAAQNLETFVAKPAPVKKPAVLKSLRESLTKRKEEVATGGPKEPAVVKSYAGANRGSSVADKERDVKKFVKRAVKQPFTVKYSARPSKRVGEKKSEVVSGKPRIGIAGHRKLSTSASRAKSYVLPRNLGFKGIKGSRLPVPSKHSVSSSKASAMVVGRYLVSSPDRQPEVPKFDCPVRPCSGDGNPSTAAIVQSPLRKVVRFAEETENKAKPERLEPYGQEEYPKRARITVEEAREKYGRVMVSKAKPAPEEVMFEILKTPKGVPYACTLSNGFLRRFRSVREYEAREDLGARLYGNAAYKVQLRLQTNIGQENILVPWKDARYGLPGGTWTTKGVKFKYPWKHVIIHNDPKPGRIRGPPLPTTSISLDPWLETESDCRFDELAVSESSLVHLSRFTG